MNTSRIRTEKSKEIEMTRSIAVKKEEPNHPISVGSTYKLQLYAYGLA